MRDENKRRIMQIAADPLLAYSKWNINGKDVDLEAIIDSGGWPQTKGRVITRKRVRDATE